jgi:hypothetical protein
MGIIVPSAIHIAPSYPWNDTPNLREIEWKAIYTVSWMEVSQFILEELLISFTTLLCQTQNAEIRIKPSPSGPDPTLGKRADPRLQTTVY